MNEKKLGEIVALAERYRGRRRAEITTEDMVSIARELDIPEEEVLAAAARVNGLSSPDAVTIHCTKSALVLSSHRVGFRWPIIARVFSAIGIQALAIGWGVRTAPTSHLMAMGAIPFVAIATYYSYRCIGLAVEKVTMVLDDVCEVRIRSLPLTGRAVSAPIGQVDVLSPEMATDEDGGFEIAPLYWLPVRIGGRLLHICTGQTKDELKAAYERISNWLKIRNGAGSNDP